MEVDLHFTLFSALGRVIREFISQPHIFSVALIIAHATGDDDEVVVSTPQFNIEASEDVWRQALVSKICILILAVHVLTKLQGAGQGGHRLYRQHR
jgi:hypothetical protein